MEQPQIHSHFTVKSNCICYGGFENILSGLLNPIQGFPLPAPETSGTVRIHKLKYNVLALNGTWTTYQLLDNDQTLRAWFACHSSVNPEEEMHKILRVSGSPYEMYSGSSFNNAATAAEGILVINRYDWGCYDKRGGNEVKDDPEVFIHPGVAIGIVGRSEANSQVLQWKSQDTPETIQAESGAWFHIDAEYLFGRFHFDEKHTAARSFLLFTERTQFMQTAFEGMSRSIRKQETPQEMFTRHLNSGERFEGLENIRLHEREIPLESDCLGDFEPEENLLDPLEWEALEVYVGEARDGIKVQTFGEPLKERIFELLNNLALTCLNSLVDPISSPKVDSIQSVASTLYPRHEEARTFDWHVYPYLTERKEENIPNFDVAPMEARIRNFLDQRCKSKDLLNDKEFIERIRQYMLYILTETLELATRCAVDNWHVDVVPSDIRLAVSNDVDLLSLFRSCKMFWYGGK